MTIHDPHTPKIIDDAAIAEALMRAHETDASCEDLLFTQVHLLDAMFKRILTHDLKSGFKFSDGTPRMDEDFLGYALKSQRAACTAINTLSLIRRRLQNPKSN